MKNIKLLFLLISIISFSSCAEKIIASNSPNSYKDFTVKSAFIQTEIPGQPNSKAQNYLHIFINEGANKDVSYVSVLFDGQMHAMTGLKGHFKINRRQGKTIKKNYNLKSNEAIIFYTIDGKNYEYSFGNIESKETIFLP